MGCLRGGPSPGNLIQPTEGLRSFKLCTLSRRFFTSTWRLGASPSRETLRIGHRVEGRDRTLTVCWPRKELMDGRSDTKRGSLGWPDRRTMAIVPEGGAIGEGTAELSSVHAQAFCLGKARRRGSPQLSSWPVGCGVDGVTSLRATNVADQRRHRPAGSNANLSRRQCENPRLALASEQTHEC
jgi:hypothetical protein